MILLCTLFRTHPNYERPLITGQALQKHGEYSFSHETLKEMTFKIWPLRVPEMTVFVTEFKLHKINDVYKREFVGKSEYFFFHDEDEDFSKKLKLSVSNSRGEITFVKYFSHFSSLNESYSDDESYLPKEKYIFEDVSLEELYKNEDFSNIINNLSQFDEEDFEGQGKGLQPSQEMVDFYENGDFSSMFDGSFNSSHQNKTEEGENLGPDEQIGPVKSDSSVDDAADLVPASPDPGLRGEDQYEDLLSMPLIYKF